MLARTGNCAHAPLTRVREALTVVAKALLLASARCDMEPKMCGSCIADASSSLYREQCKSLKTD